MVKSVVLVARCEFFGKHNTGAAAVDIDMFFGNGCVQSSSWLPSLGSSAEQKSSFLRHVRFQEILECDRHSICKIWFHG